MMFADGWRFVVDGLDDSDYGGVVNNRLWLRIHEPDYQTLNTLSELVQVIQSYMTGSLISAKC